MAWWCNGKVSDLPIKRSSNFDSRPFPPSDNLGKVVHTHHASVTIKQYNLVTVTELRFLEERGTERGNTPVRGLPSLRGLIGA